MANRNYKSRSLRRVNKKTPGSTNSTHYRRKNPKGAFCGVSGDALNGVSRKRPGRFNSLSKSKKRPNRKFGGTLSHKVVRTKIEESIWSS